MNEVQDDEKILSRVMEGEEMDSMFVVGGWTTSDKILREPVFEWAHLLARIYPTEKTVKASKGVHPSIVPGEKL